MRRADAVIVPSLRDDAPLTIAEAQALGVPVVAFDQGGAAVMGRLPGTSVSLVRPASTAAAARCVCASARRHRRERRAAKTVPKRSVCGELEDYIAQLYASVIRPEASRRR